MVPAAPEQITLHIVRRADKDAHLTRPRVRRVGLYVPHPHRVVHRIGQEARAARGE